MAGYIGSKAVTLSTTAADVAGNAVIDGDLTVKGTTVTIDSAAVQEIRLGDNDKMTFGDATGGDLQIYHDGTHSYVDENGTGQLKIRSNGTGVLLQTVSGENLATFANNAAVNLYYDNAAKLATTSTGIDVTGTVTADGLTVDGGTAYHKLISTFPATYTTNLQVGQQVNISNNAVTDTLSIENTGTAAATNIQFSTAGSEAMRIDSSGRLLLGTTTAGESSADDLTIATTGQTGITLRSGTANAGAIYFADGTSGTAQYSGYIYYGHSNNALGFATNATERMRIDSSGDVAIGGTSTAAWNGAQGRKFIVSGANNTIVSLQSSTTSANQGVILEGYATSVTSGSPALGSIAFVRENTSTTSLNSFTAFYTNYAGTPDERMRIDSSGNLLVGKTSAGIGNVGFEFNPNGYMFATRSGGYTANFNRQTSDGDIVVFNKDGSTVGSIGNASSNSIYIAGNTGALANLGFGGSSLMYPTVDNVADLGASGLRFDDIYATNGTIQTSDQNEKQQIASLTDAEMTAAKAISKLFKTFKWNDSVAEKGDAARTHTGVIAQEVEQAMTDAGLNAGDYAFFISTTWWEADETYTDDDGVEQTRTNTYETAEEAPEGATERNRKGIRYPQLLSFIGAATEQRLASIESRLDALEGN